LPGTLAAPRLSTALTGRPKGHGGKTQLSNRHRVTAIPTQATPIIRLPSSDEPTAESPPQSSFSFASDGAVGPTSTNLPTDKERRRYARWPLGLRGRYMLEDGSEFPCHTVDVSPAGMAFIGRPTGNIGEWVVAYIDGFGRIEGTIVRRSVVWFAVRVAATSGKLERLAGKINSLVPREDDGLLDRPPTIGGDSDRPTAYLQARER